MDHLGIAKFHTLGGCIGASFCLKLCEVAPERVTAMVLQNPIGLHPDFPTYFPDSFAEWSNEQRAARPDLDEAALRSFGENMWAGEFVFSVSRDFVRRCSVLGLVLPGDDTPHPAVTGRELAEILPDVRRCTTGKVPHIWTNNVTAFSRSSRSTRRVRLPQVAGSPSSPKREAPNPRRAGCLLSASGR